jgi:hypothetical protein
MSEEVVELVRPYRAAIHTTVFPESMPNVSPKGGLTVLDRKRFVLPAL